jgi:hypothetical protein
MEVIDDQSGVGQQRCPVGHRGADRGGVDRGRIDRDELDRIAELGALLKQPVDDGLGGASFALPQQPLIAGQIDETVS